MSGAGCSQDCSTCSITRSACSLSPGLFLLHPNTDLGRDVDGSCCRRIYLLRAKAKWNWIMG